MQEIETGEAMDYQAADTIPSCQGRPFRVRSASIWMVSVAIGSVRTICSLLLVNSLYVDSLAGQ